MGEEICWKPGADNAVKRRQSPAVLHAVRWVTGVQLRLQWFRFTSVVLA